MTNLHGLEVKKLGPGGYLVDNIWDVRQDGSRWIATNLRDQRSFTRHTYREIKDQLLWQQSLKRVTEVRSG